MSEYGIRGLMVRFARALPVALAAGLLVTGLEPSPLSSPHAGSSHPHAVRADATPFSPAALSSGGWLLVPGALETSSSGAWSHHGDRSSTPACSCPAFAASKTSPAAALARRPVFRPHAHGRYGSRSTTIPPPTA